MRQKQIFYKKTHWQWICDLNWQLWCCFWHQWSVESLINGDSDWHGENGDMLPLRYTQEYLALGICSQIKSAAVENWYNFYKIHTGMLQWTI